MARGSPPDTRLLRFLARHGPTGAFVALVFAYALVKLDLFGLGSLIEASRHGLLAFVLLCAGLAVTFASLAMATAVFLLPKDEDRWR